MVPLTCNEQALAWMRKAQAEKMPRAEWWQAARAAGITAMPYNNARRMLGVLGKG